jgi:hypothetical protein
MFGETMLKPEKERAGRSFLDAMRKAANELQSEQEIFSPENLAIWNEYTKVPEAQIQKGAPYAYSKDLALDAKSVLDQQAFMLRAGRLDYTDLLPESKVIDTSFGPRR